MAKSKAKRHKKASEEAEGSCLCGANSKPFLHACDISRCVPRDTAGLANHVLISNNVDKPKLSFLILPLLKILSTTRHAANEKTAIFSLASQLLGDVESSLKSSEYNVQTKHKVESCPQGMVESCPQGMLKKSSICENVMILIKSSTDESVLLNWLTSVETSLSNSGTGTKEYSFISLLLSSFLLTCSESVASHVLATIAFVCNADPTQVD
ncbi:Hypothetical predicted protein [Paramuricea clavata]|uniref:Uncharacterized protein n=1 Tax=Paramuricea clavata TaxID=317549 RepID=A0A7D9JDU7_PARCT|nr:Hypothetical predicted protein [Paramuricea clavata]